MTDVQNSTPRTDQLSGIWRSDYTYHNSTRDADLVNHHYVQIYPKDGQLVIESVPGRNNSYLIARFWIDGDVATGSWQEVTSQDGDYKGAIYHGAAQLIISKDRKKISGKWVGFGKKMDVKTGPWDFIYLGEDISAIDKDS